MVRLIDKVIYFSLCSWLLVDTVLGLFAYVTGNNSFQYGSILFRMIVFILLLIRGLTFLNSSLVKLFFAFFLSFLCLLYVQVFIMSSQQIIYSLQTSIKVVSPILSTVVIYNLIKRGKFDERMFKSVILINVLMLLFNCLLFYFDIGKSNYGITKEGIMRGGRGFIFAGNEVAGLLVVLYLLSLLFLCSTKLKSVVIIVLFGLSTVALFSKTAIISYLLLSGIFIFQRYKYAGVPLLVFFVGIIILNINRLLETFSFISLLVDRWRYFFTKYGPEVFLLGGYKRVSVVGEQLNALSDYPFHLLTGFGWSGKAENNLVDLLYGYGIIGVGIYLLWLLAFIFPLSVSRRFGSSNGCFLQSTTLLLLAMVATFAGHIVQSAMISVFWAMLISCQFVESSRFEVKNEK